MKDCASCQHRVEIHPEYRDMDWDELPCATCCRDDGDKGKSHSRNGDTMQVPAFALPSVYTKREERMWRGIAGRT